MRYRLRALMILLAIGPPMLAVPFCGVFVPIETIFRIQVGMTRAEVEAIAGRPMERSKTSDGGEYWGYYTGVSSCLGPEMVEFDNSGRVLRTWSQ